MLFLTLLSGYILLQFHPSEMSEMNTGSLVEGDEVNRFEKHYFFFFFL